MKISILSYGSLVKNAGKLVKGKWTNKETPVLPLELCRIAQNKRLVLAINEENGVANNVYAATAATTDLNKAIPAFMANQKIGEKQIGIIDLVHKTASDKANKHPNISRTIALWARKNGIEAVLFSFLSRKFKDAINIPFSVQNAVTYINGLDAKTKKLQIDYLNSIPAGIETPVLTVLKDAMPKAKVKAKAKKTPLFGKPVKPKAKKK